MQRESQPSRLQLRQMYEAKSTCAATHLSYGTPLRAVVRTLHVVIGSPVRAVPRESEAAQRAWSAKIERDLLFAITAAAPTIIRAACGAVSAFRRRSERIWQEIREFCNL